jgi:hypothetical protein
MTKVKPKTNRGRINFPLFQFSGHYVPDAPNSLYFKNTVHGVTFKLCERKEPTPLRPQYYLMQRQDSNAWVYLTSLYPNKNGFTAEIEGHYFKVSMLPDKGGFTVLG